MLKSIVEIEIERSGLSVSICMSADAVFPSATVTFIEFDLYPLFDAVTTYCPGFTSLIT